MYYKEYLALRRPLAWTVGLLLIFGAIPLLSLRESAAPHGVSFSLTGTLLFQNAWFIACFAIIAGTSIGQESGDVARLALVRPIPRLRAAATIFGMGAASILLATLFGWIVSVAPMVVFGGARFFDFHKFGWITVWFPITFALAFYGMSAFASVVARKTQLPALLVALGACILYVVGFMPGLAPTLSKLNVVNPLSYYLTGINILVNPHLAGNSYGFFGTLSTVVDVYALLGIFVLSVALAGIRFCRVTL